MRVAVLVDNKNSINRVPHPISIILIREPLEPRCNTRVFLWLSIFDAKGVVP